MEPNEVRAAEHEEDEEEFVLLDLEDLFGQFDIPTNAPYTLTNLDTMNPIMIIDGRFKLIGEYEETIGTCFVLSEDGDVQTNNEERRPSEKSPATGNSTPPPKQASGKQVKPVARLHKILKFRILLDDEVQDAVTKQFQHEASEPSN